MQMSLLVRAPKEIMVTKTFQKYLSLPSPVLNSVGLHAVPVTVLPMQFSSAWDLLWNYFLSLSFLYVFEVTTSHDVKYSKIAKKYDYMTQFSSRRGDRSPKFRKVPSS